ncbi:E3 ubiquitin/ISG15 ligase TRIM25-like [Aquarana catesbeiana]|uniref:E3 ubiquitin/ISG15 ligase TRIM25-like n=1 Tax=Aquarana catesbeiana TaxID=8400 RepID=UPI003CC995D8
MASADLRAELKCGICLNIFTDPIMLPCGHNFCRVCIDRVLNAQEESRYYVCPVCRKGFRSRPALQRNITLRNIAVHFLSAQPNQEEFRVFCNYCVNSPVPAVRSCLLCFVSLCDKHLRVHNKSPEHILCDPTLFMESRKCPVHKKILEYYCTDDETCVCEHCCTGRHKGHNVVSVNEDYGKKDLLRNVLKKVLTKKKEIKKRVQSLQEHRRKVEETAAGNIERVIALFRALRRRLGDLERHIFRWAEWISISIQDMEIKKEELSRKMRHIEELCNMTDPLTVLQESDTGDLCDTEDGDNEDRERYEKLLHCRGGLECSGVFHTIIADIVTEVNVCFPIQEADILLDVNTAYNYLQISDDRKTVSMSVRYQNRPERPQRFEHSAQVMSIQSFFSGRHYWEVEIGGSESWAVGICYPSIGRGNRCHTQIGEDTRSWGLYREEDRYYVVHNIDEIPIPAFSSNRVRVELDYEGGRISFYDLCDPIRPLHTFAIFTEPLHAILGVWDGYLKICGEEL